MTKMTIPIVNAKSEQFTYTCLVNVSNSGGSDREVAQAMTVLSTVSTVPLGV